MSLSLNVERLNFEIIYVQLLLGHFDIAGETPTIGAQIPISTTVTELEAYVGAHLYILLCCFALSLLKFYLDTVFRVCCTGSLSRKCRLVSWAKG